MEGREAKLKRLKTGQLYRTMFMPFAIFSLLLLFTPPAMLYAQEEEPDYYEIPVFIDVPRIGGGEIDAVICGTELYLPVTDLFDFLKIKNIPTPALDSVSGFFINIQAPYVIDRINNRIIYQEKQYNLEKGDLIRTESNLYLRADFFGKVFGLECSFNFRSLSVTVNSTLELPLIREMRQEAMRANLSRLKGDAEADTVVTRTYPLFKFGMADWSAFASEEINGKTNARLNLNLGSMLAGGEATASLNYNIDQPFTERQQYYQWRYVNNDFSPLRQVIAGKIATHSTSSIYNPVVGVQFTNTPTTYRRSFGSYTLSERTEPGWIVELYVNNVLVDYVKADASGFFTFEVPLVYGNSMVKLKFFGPWGEERVKEQNIVIPFNFLPEKTFEYTVSAGIVEDGDASKFSRASLNYGVTRSLTIGTGAEYLSSVTSSPLMPYFNASLRITNSLLFSGEYTMGVKAKGNLSYRLPSNIQFNLNYTWYDKEQKAISFNYREERKATISAPLKIGKFSSYQRLSLYQIVLPSAKYTTGEWLFSGSLLGVNTNLTTYALFIDRNDPYLYSNLSLALRLPGGFLVMPQVQYGYSQKELMTGRVAIEKRLMDHAFLNLSYEHNFRNNYRMAELGFRYDFSFAQTGMSVRRSGPRTSLIQYARGSIINDSKTKYLGTDNRPNVGRGGITIIPFLDKNANGVRDKGEPAAYGLNIKANSGRVERSERDTTIRILGLEPYTSCFIDLDPNSFENIAWRIPVQTMSVTVDPNILKSIEIPVWIAGEASGWVNLAEDGTENGLGRVIVSFYTADRMVAAGKTLSEDDGYFSYFGLSPGEYIVRVDSAQMRRLDLIAEPETISFSIGEGTEGDYIDNLNFRLRKKTAEPADSITAPAVKPEVRKDTTYMIIHEITQELVTITEDSWAIQLGAFKRKSNADALSKKLARLLGKDVEIVIENDFYKVRIIGIKTREEVDRNISILRDNGITEIWVIRLKAKEQQWVLREVNDTILDIRETMADGTLTEITPDMSIQIGAFRQEANAIALMNRISFLVDRKVKIVVEDGYYKVRITGFETGEEMERLIPSLGLFGLKDIWVLPVSRPADIVPVTPVVPETDVLTDTIRIEEQVIKADTLIIEDTPADEARPTIALQVGLYIKQSDALRAQRRIISKLNRPVEIVEQWGYYRVIITGFYTREETNSYYPELFGMGFTNITLIDNWQ